MGIYKSTYDRPHLEWMSIGVNEIFHCNGWLLQGFGKYDYALLAVRYMMLYDVLTCLKVVKG